MKPVRIGCSGWVYQHWRGKLYPEDLPQRRWLEHYAAAFATVEVNNTFYRLPSSKAVQEWVDRTPPEFLFALKASRYLTHVKRLADLERGIGRLYEPLEPLRDAQKMGPILWQLPPTFQRDDERLENALRALPAGRHCFEFRHESWFVDDVYSILRGHDAALVIGDTPERPFQARKLTADWTFIRFHYGRRGRNGRYSERELETWKRRIAAWRPNVEVFAYFDNDWEGHAVDNALWLKQRLS